MVVFSLVLRICNITYILYIDINYRGHSPSVSSVDAAAIELLLHMYVSSTRLSANYRMFTRCTILLYKAKTSFLNKRAVVRSFQRM